MTEFVSKMHQVLGSVPVPSTATRKRSNNSNTVVQIKLRRRWE